MTYNVKTFQLTENGMMPLDYYKSEHFIQQEDAAILLNDIFVIVFMLFLLLIKYWLLGALIKMILYDWNLQLFR